MGLALIAVSLLIGLGAAGTAIGFGLLGGKLLEGLEGANTDQNAGIAIVRRAIEALASESLFNVICFGDKARRNFLETIQQLHRLLLFLLFSVFLERSTFFSRPFLRESVHSIARRFVRVPL